MALFSRTRTLSCLGQGGFVTRPLGRAVARDFSRWATHPTQGGNTRRLKPQASERGQVALRRLGNVQLATRGSPAGRTRRLPSRRANVRQLKPQAGAALRNSEDANGAFPHNLNDTPAGGVHFLLGKSRNVVDEQVKCAPFRPQACPLLGLEVQCKAATDSTTRSIRN